MTKTPFYAFDAKLLHLAGRPHVINLSATPNGAQADGLPALERKVGILRVETRAIRHWMESARRKRVELSAAERASLEELAGQAAGGRIRWRAAKQGLSALRLPEDAEEGPGYPPLAIAAVNDLVAETNRTGVPWAPAGSYFLDDPDLQEWARRFGAELSVPQRRRRAPPAPAAAARPARSARPGRAPANTLPVPDEQSPADTEHSEGRRQVQKRRPIRSGRGRARVRPGDLFFPTQTVEAAGEDVTLDARTGAPLRWPVLSDLPAPVPHRLIADHRDSGTGVRRLLLHNEAEDVYQVLSADADESLDARLAASYRPVSEPRAARVMAGRACRQELARRRYRLLHSDTGAEGQFDRVKAIYQLVSDRKAGELRSAALGEAMAAAWAPAAEAPTGDDAAAFRLLARRLHAEAPVYRAVMERIASETEDPAERMRALARFHEALENQAPLRETRAATREERFLVQLPGGAWVDLRNRSTARRTVFGAMAAEAAGPVAGAPRPQGGEPKAVDDGGLTVRAREQADLLFEQRHLVRRESVEAEALRRGRRLEPGLVAEALRTALPAGKGEVGRAGPASLVSQPGNAGSDGPGGSTRLGVPPGPAGTVARTHPAPGRPPLRQVAEEAGLPVAEAAPRALPPSPAHRSLLSAAGRGGRPAVRPDARGPIMPGVLGAPRAPGAGTVRFQLGTLSFVRSAEANRPQGAHRPAGRPGPDAADPLSLRKAGSEPAQPGYEVRIRGRARAKLPVAGLIHGALTQTGVGQGSIHVTERDETALLTKEWVQGMVAQLFR